MAKVLVFQHVPYEPLGTLDPLIRQRKHRIRYVNFGRDPYQQPNLEGYDGLIILGGPMNIGEEDKHPHLNTEKRAILQAIEMGIPVLGICLGAQLIASAMKSAVYPAREKEIGWYCITKTKAHIDDPVFNAFETTQSIFQWHGYTFDLPKNSVHLLKGEGVPNQAFKVASNVYGFQFHLEADAALIKRWVNLPAHQVELGLDKDPQRAEQIWQETQKNIGQSLQLSHKVFSAFLDLLPQVKQKHTFSHKNY